MADDTKTKTEARDPQAQTYLGDGLYARFDGYQVWLETGDGRGVALESDTASSLARYIQSIRDAYDAQDWGAWP